MKYSTTYFYILIYFPFPYSITGNKEHSFATVWQIRLFHVKHWWLIAGQPMNILVIILATTDEVKLHHLALKNKIPGLLSDL